jgi:hypothetical protein
MRGTKANILIRQGKEQNYKPVVYLELLKSGPDSEKQLMDAIGRLQNLYPGLALKKAGKECELIIPEKLKVPHEEHFAEVVKNYLTYLKGAELPAWEVTNMLAKYYTTTKAAEMASKK